MDNECSATIKAFIKDEMNTKLQFFGAHEHRVNAAERAIQTFKNHVIAGLCTVHQAFPMQLWCELLHQAELTLNLLRSSHINPRLSTYAVLEGESNFDRTPLAPPVTKALVYKDPKTRTTWETHARDAWYVGPAPDHYRCFRFFMPNTKGFRISKTAKFFPAYCTIPTIDAENTAIVASQDLVTALTKHKTNKLQFSKTHQKTLKKLASIFSQAIKPSSSTLPDNPPPRVEDDQSLRVKNIITTHNTKVTPVITDSGNPTIPDILKSQKHVHLKRT